MILLWTHGAMDHASWPIRLLCMYKHQALRCVPEFHLLWLTNKICLCDQTHKKSWILKFTWAKTIHTFLCSSLSREKTRLVCSVNKELGSLCHNSLYITNTYLFLAACSASLVVINLSHEYKLLMRLMSPSGKSKEKTT